MENDLLLFLNVQSLKPTQNRGLSRWNVMRNIFNGIVVVMATCILSLSARAEADVSSGAAVTVPTSKLTVLFDAFGKDPGLQKDWGYSAFIEIGGKRILFDAGNNPEVLEHNVKAKGIDLSKLDFIVISHRHGDHVGGLSYVLSVNPNVKIYAPKEAFGVFGSSLPSNFYRKDATLAPEKRYFDGSPPNVMTFGTAWPNANIELVDKTLEIVPGISLISLVSDKPGTLELRELSLALETPHGLVLVVGCSHPGIDRIVEAATSIDKRILSVVGGMHLAVAQESEIERLASALHDRYQVGWIAPGHCTGEPAFSALERKFGIHYLYAGLGSVIGLSPDPRRADVAKPERQIMDLEDLRDYRKIKRDMLTSFGRLAKR